MRKRGTLAQVFSEKIQKTDFIPMSRKVGRDGKESIQAYMRVQINGLLHKYDYPLEKAKER